MRLTALMLLPLLLAGCVPDPANETMLELTKDRRALLVADDAGNRYVVTHVYGNEYLVQPVDSPARAVKGTE